MAFANYSPIDKTPKAQKASRDEWQRLISTVKKKTGTFKLYSPGMDQSDTSRRSVIFGILTVTLPALAFVPLSVLFGLYVFGPSWWPYYVTGGLALGWQWYSEAMP